MDDGTAMIPLPVEFVERMERQLRNELPDFLHALSLPPVRGIRIHPGKPFDGIEKYTKNQQVPWEKNGYLLEASSTAGGTVFHEAGAFYLQEPAAMLPAAVLDARPGEKILDLCAAPGGKTTHLAELCGGNCEITALDINESRTELIKENCERLGLDCVTVRCMDASKISKDKESRKTYDLVLCDVPCSGLGLIGKKPDIRQKITYDDIESLLSVQADILEHASKMVRPGGTLVYCTCTLNSDENGEQVDSFLEKHKNFHTVPIKSYLPSGLAIDERREEELSEGRITLFPDTDGCEGFFICRMERDKKDKD
jgi:16S rRNA (cytosine967-C5)-methyltransferase